MAAQNPDDPMDDGKIGLPRTDGAMNRLGPSAGKGGKGSKKESSRLKTEEQSKKEANQALLQRARKRFERASKAEADNRKAALDDLKHKTGEGQWPQDVVSDRNLDNRPCLTINKLRMFCRQVVNEVRENRPQIKVSPVGDKSDKDVAKFYRGLIRSIERDCNADIAYDTGFEQAVDGGFGYWRILTEYDKNSFDQVIVIRRIRNRFSVYLDPTRQEPDGSDAKWGFITEMMDRSEFEDKYPKADPMPWIQGGVGETLKDWINEKEVRVAEYYEIDYEPRRLVMLGNGHVGYWDELDDEAKGQEVVEERDVDYPQVKWYKLTATEILDRRDWPGQWIPIVEVIGQEDDVEGKVKKSGLIRDAKTPQQMYNFNRTLGVELVSLQPKAPYVVEEGQIEGYEDIWKTANTKNHAYLPYRGTSIGDTPAPPPRREQFAGAPAGVLAEVQAAAQDFMAVTGLRFDATLGERVYDESGRALRELQKKGDVGTFHYIDNFARSLRHTGQILIDLIPKIYDTKRMVTILRDDDSEEQAQVNPASGVPMKQVAMDGPAGPKTKLLKIFDPTIGRYGVTVTIGPSAATRRIEAFDSMIEFIRVLPPQIAGQVADLVAKNADWDGADEMAARLAKMLPPNILDDPAMKDVPPQAQALIQQLKGQLQALGNEKMQLLKALTDTQADRAQRERKIERDFEAKLLAILQKADAAAQQNIGQRIEGLADAIMLLHERLSQPPEEQPEP